jgi:hypothetical protein
LEYFPGKNSVTPGPEEAPEDSYHNYAPKSGQGMKITKKQIDKIEEALLAAHRRQEEVQFPPDWRQQLMKDLRARSWPAPAPLVSRRILSWAAASLTIIAGILILANLDWYDPWIKIKSAITFVDCRAEVCLEAGDRDSGLKHLEVTVIQAGREIPVLFYEIKQPKSFLGLFGAKTPEAATGPRQAGGCGS